MCTIFTVIYSCPHHARMWKSIWDWFWDCPNLWYLYKIGQIRLSSPMNFIKILIKLTPLFYPLVKIFDTWPCSNRFSNSFRKWGLLLTGKNILENEVHLTIENSKSLPIWLIFPWSHFIVWMRARERAHTLGFWSERTMTWVLDVMFLPVKSE